MEAKKDIGKAFREKLDSLDRVPGDALWDTISKDLDNKKKKRFPFWFYICGSLLAIVCLVYFLTLLNPNNSTTVTKKGNLQNDNFTHSPVSTSVENNLANKKTFNDSVINDMEDSLNRTNNTIVTNSTTAPSKGSNKLRNNSKKSNTTHTTDKVVIRTSASSKNNREKSNATIGRHHKQKTKTLDETASVGNSKNAKKGNKFKKHSTSSYNSKTKTALASGNGNTELDNIANTSISKIRNRKTSGKSKITEKRADYKSGKQPEKQLDNIPDAIIAAPSTTTGTEIAISERIPAKAQDSLPEKVVILKDSLKTELPKEEVAEKNKKDSLPPVIVKRFSVFAYGGPSFFNFPNRDILTETTTSNIDTKSSTRLGVLFGYRINNKLSIRTGVSVYKLKQSASDIKLNYVMGGGSATNPELIPSADFSWIDYEQPFGTNSGQIINILGENYQAIINIDRELSYLEIPLEIGYNLFDRKFGIDVFGGGNMLLLTKNEVSAYNEKGKMHLGTWNAAAKTSFTGTLGLDLHYNFSPSLQVNAEPTLNYYFNTYKDSKPSSFTIRVGIQYNFDIGSKKK